MRGAGFAKVSTPSDIPRGSRKPPKRADVTCFSERSRQRLRIKIASVVRGEPPLFCTLTYPAEWIWDTKLWKRHLKIFSQRFLRRWIGAGFIWKLEFQQRGAPHFHPFVWGISDSELREFRQWLSEVWNAVAGNGESNHLLAGTRVEQMRNPGAAIRYVSGYAAKTDQTRPGEKVGRYWGVVGRERIAWGRPEVVSLNQQQSKVVLRTIRRYMRVVNRETRIKRVAKMVGATPSELISWGWFNGRPIHWGKHLRSCGLRMPQKLRLRNLQSVNVFLNVDFWFEKILRLIAMPSQ